MSDELPKKPVTAVTVREVQAPLGNLADRETPVVVPPPAPLRQVRPQPEEPERSYPLMELEYDTLLQGEKVSGPDNLRWALWGAAVTAFATTAGVLETAGLTDIFKGGVRPVCMFFLLVAGGLAASAAAVFATFLIRALRGKGDSPYAKLKKRIEARLRPGLPGRSPCDTNIIARLLRRCRL